MIGGIVPVCGLREAPRHRADAVTRTTSRRWRGIATPSSRCGDGSTSRRRRGTPETWFPLRTAQATINKRGGHKTWHSFGSPDPGEAVYSYSDFVPVSETFVNCQILPSSPRRWCGPAAQPRPKSSSIAAGNSTCVAINQCVSGAPDNSSLSHVSATTRPCWLRRAVRNEHHHAIEQASRRWRGGRREDSARTP